MDDAKLPITEHLGELRKRIVISLVSVLGFFVVAFTYSEHLFSALTFPLKAELRLSLSNPYLQVVYRPSPTSLVFLAPAEAFWMHMKVSFVASVIASLPVIFSQVWKFVSPGLLPRERRYVLPFIIVATALFVAGAFFCFVVILPFAMTFLLEYKTGTLTPMLSVGSYIDFCLKFILAFGAVFELPLVIIFLTRLGIVTPRTLARQRKYAVILAFVLAAILTPTPDAFNQVLMAVPIIILFETGILLSRILAGKEERGQRRSGQEPEGDHD